MDESLVTNIIDYGQRCSNHLRVQENSHYLSLERGKLLVNSHENLARFKFDHSRAPRCVCISSAKNNINPKVQRAQRSTKLTDRLLSFHMTPSLLSISFYGLFNFLSFLNYFLIIKQREQRNQNAKTCYLSSKY